MEGIKNAFWRLREFKIEFRLFSILLGNKENLIAETTVVSQRLTTQLNVVSGMVFDEFKNKSNQPNHQFTADEYLRFHTRSLKI